MNRELGNQAQRGDPSNGGALAVFTPCLGLPSETFIHRHATAILPGRTVVVTNKLLHRSRATGERGVPALVLPVRPGPVAVLERMATRTFHSGLGWPPTRRQAEDAGKFLRAHGVTAVLLEYLHHGAHWAPFLRGLGARIVAHAHGYDVSSLLRHETVRRSYRAYDERERIVTVSEYSKGRLVEIGIEPTRISVVPCGVDVPISVPEPAEAAGGVVRCLAVGRLVPKKGILHTLRSFARARTCGVAMALDVVGDGPLRRAAMAEAARLCLGRAVTFHGTLASAEVRRLGAASDIFLHHAVRDSRSGDEEGLPVALLEAMAAGLPVVSTVHAGIPEAVTEGENGFLVPAGDESAMADRITLLAESADLRYRMGRRSWEFAAARFSWQRERDVLLKLLGLV